MEKIETEKVFIIAATVVVCFFLGTVFFTSVESRHAEKQKYDTCIAKGGSWIPTSGEGICIQRGSF